MSLAAWDDRIRRTAALAEEYAFARDFLYFYRELLFFQKSVYDHLATALWVEDLDESGACPIHDGAIDPHLPILLTFFSSFLSLVERQGPLELAQLAKELLADARRGEWASELVSYWRRELDKEDDPERLVLLFFPKAFLQPYAEFLADHHNRDLFRDGEEAAPGRGARCPLCGRRPQLSVLRAAADGARRSLLCSLCATEWRYPRIGCPACGERRSACLSCYTAPDFPHVRVESCDACHAYLKGIDLTVTGRAVPVVDEIATLPLDLWAVEHGYRKIEMNLMGV